MGETQSCLFSSPSTPLLRSIPGIASGIQRTHRAALDRFSGEEHPVASGGPVAPVHLRSHGRLMNVNDAERLSQDPAFRLIGSEKIWERGAALTSRLQSFGSDGTTEAREKSRRFAGDQSG